MHRWDVYRGRRSGGAAGRLPAILLFLAVFVFLVAVTVFFALPSYLVYTKDTVTLDLPSLRQDAAATPAAGTVTEDGTEVLIDPSQLTNGTLAEETPSPEEAAEDYSQLAAELVVEAPDYSNMAYATGEGLEIVQSVYVPYEKANETGLALAVAQARNLEIKALTIELRDETGMLAYASEQENVINYALGGTWNMEETLASLKEQGYYLTAVVSSCVDSTWASRNAPATLKDSAGFPFSNSLGAWMDPWNMDVRQMTIDIASELMRMGFDEVVLDHVEHPLAQVQYSRAMSGELTRVACVTNFAIAVREGLEEVMAETGCRLSAMMDTEAMNSEDIDNGQNLAYFLKIFDRVYEFTETYQEAGKVVELHIDSTERFVPIISWVFPGASWAENFFAETGD